MSADQPLPVDDVTRVGREAHRQVTDRAALHAILDEALLAHVAVVRDGLPLVLPFAVARDGDSLILHGSSGAGGLRLGAGGPVCVSVAHVDGLVFARTTFESSMRYRSAVVHGVAEVVPDDEKEHVLEVLSDHLFAGRTAEVRRPLRKELAATLVLRLPLDSASVKVAAGPPEIDPDDVEPRDVWAGIVPMALVAGEPVANPDVPDGVEVPDSVRRTLTRFG
jgi:nitroimidazol reductase NimA-like FMN-containing flavoprotein (pyridoxamine 5'-phosphate oxidase superfamily)